MTLTSTALRSKSSLKALSVWRSGEARAWSDLRSIGLAPDVKRSVGVAAVAKAVDASHQSCMVWCGAATRHWIAAVATVAISSSTFCLRQDRFPRVLQQ